MSLDTHYTVTTKFKVSFNDITDLLCCGLEGNIDHWAFYRVGFTPNPEELAEYVSGPYRGLPQYAIQHPDYVIIVVDKETLEEYRVTLGRLKLGLTDMALKYPGHFMNFIQGDSDSETGDVFIQCCVFGDIIYG